MRVKLSKLLNTAVFALLLVACDSSVSTATAEVKVHVFFMSSLTSERETALLSEVQEEYASHNIQLKYTAIESLEPFSSKVTSQKAFEDKGVTADFRAWLISKGYNDRRTIYYGVFPPMRDDRNNKVVAGRACGICSYRKTLACAHSNAVNERSLNREHPEEFNKIAMAHEIGHLLGATHVDSAPNIMHSSALQFAGDSVSFLSRTIEQIKGCLTTRRREIRRTIQKYCVRGNKRCARQVRRGTFKRNKR